MLCVSPNENASVCAPGHSTLDRMLAEVQGIDGGVRLLEVDESIDRPGLAGIVDAARAHGFVCVNPGDPIADADREAVLHRHVLFICARRSDREQIVSWIRQLAQVSARRHLVFWPAGQRALVADESAAYPTPAEVGRSLPANDRLRRADRWMRRGRSRASERWLVAAAASAHRHGDTGSAWQIELSLCRRLVENDRSETAGIRLRALLKASALPWSYYAEATALLAGTAIAAGQMLEASALVVSAETEARLRQAAVPDGLQERRAELDFWCSDSSSREDESGSSEAIGWRALTAWRCGKPARLGALMTCLHDAVSRNDRCARFWIDVLAVLTQPSPAQVVLHAANAPGTSRRTLLLRAARAWSLLRAGATREALAMAETPRSMSPEGQLIRALRDQAAGMPSSPHQLRLAGVRGFLQERTTMVSIEALSRLVKVMDEASDETAALNAGCSWIRSFAREAPVAVVAADGLRFLAGAGWKASDLMHGIAAILAGRQRDVLHAAGVQIPEGFAIAVRSGGVSIARLVVGPGASDAGVVVEAAQAVAMLSVATVRSCLDAHDLRAQEREGLQDILGRSEAIAEVRVAIGRAATTSFPVLIEGESGTGKELAARAVHKLSARRDRRFLAVNCAALTDELVEAELFGHSRGAFTGAVAPRPGLFEEAHGGTLFLDEVAELSPRAQAKLLRTLQEREVRRVGESTSRPVDVRIVAASNASLADAVAHGKFRDDLRFRLAVVTIRLPALRERLEDIAILSHVFWRRVLAETGRRSFLGAEALARLARHGWPGNVRELQNVISGLAVSVPSGRVTARHVSEVISQVSGPPRETAAAVSLDAARRVFERRLIAETMARHAGRRSAAAQDLGLTRQGLAKALRRLGLTEDEDAAGVA